MTTPESYEGSCFCGRVKYRISAPAKFVAHDHCSMCRRIAGAPFVTWCGVPEGQFAMVAGEGALSTFASSEHATRQFCSTCGSHLFFRSTRWPGEVHVTLATLDKPEGLVPMVHVYYSDRAPWLDLDAKLLCLGGPTGTEPLGA